MRRFAVSLVVLSLCSGVVVADEHEDFDKVPIELLADRILGGDGAESEALIERASEMEATELKILFRAVRNRHIAYCRLDSKRVSSVQLASADLDQAIAFLQTITGFRVHLSKKAREEKFEDILIDVNLRDVTARTFLNLITRPYELYWSMQGEVVFITTRDELVVRPREVESRALLLRLAETKVSLAIQDQKFTDVVSSLQVQTGLNVMIDNRIAHDIGPKIVSRLHVEDVSLRTILNLLCEHGGETVVWVVRGNVIKFTTEEFLR